MLLLCPFEVLASKEEATVEPEHPNRKRILEESYYHKVDEQDCLRIKTPLIALKLIDIDYMNRSEHFGALRSAFEEGATLGTVITNVWKLTPQGKRLLAELSAIQKG